MGEDAEYTVSRTFSKGSNGSKTRLGVHRIVDGDHRRIDAGQTLIGSIIPKPMAKYFFFDGEAAYVLRPPPSRWSELSPNQRHPGAKRLGGGWSVQVGGGGVASQ
jgi:hypothetical protein